MNASESVAWIGRLSLDSGRRGPALRTATVPGRLRAILERPAILEEFC
jgi:hypothetical protein